MAYTTFTLADLKANLASRVDGSVFWDTSGDEVRLALNEVLSLWNLCTGTWRTGIDLPTVAGQVDYDFTAPLTFGMRVLFNTVPLLLTSQAELNLGQPNWRLETTASGGGLPPVPTLWAPISLLRIAVWPADAAGGGTLRIEGVAATPILLEDGDFVDLADEWIDMFTECTLHLLAFKEGGPRWRATLPLFQGFLAAAAEQNGVLKANQRFRQYAGLNRQRDLVRAQGLENKLDQMVPK